MALVLQGVRVLSVWGLGLDWGSEISVWRGLLGDRVNWSTSRLLRLRKFRT